MGDWACVAASLLLFGLSAAFAALRMAKTRSSNDVSQLWTSLTLAGVAFSALLAAGRGADWMVVAERAAGAVFAAGIFMAVVWFRLKRKPPAQ